MKPADRQQIEFIKSLVRKGMSRADIMVKFQKKWPLSRSRFDVRKAIANKEMTEENQSIQKTAEANISKEAKELQAKIMTSLERQAYLSQIARGEIEIPTTKPMATKDGIEMIHLIELPNHSDRIKAIAELNKMHGDYAPTKTDITINKVGLDAIKETYE